MLKFASGTPTSSVGFPLDRSIDRLKWIWISGVWGIAALLSTVQIYLQHSMAGRLPIWGETLAANVVAWLPWLLIAPLILRFERRVPLRIGTSIRWRNLALHIVASTLVSVSFLFYLTWFRILYLENAAPPLSPGVFLAVYGEQAGDFFLVVVITYGAVAAAGFGTRVFRHGLAEEGTPTSPDLRRVGGNAGRAGQTQEDRALMIVDRSIGRTRWLDPETICWIEASGIYVTLHRADGTVLLRRSLSSLERDLAGRRFARIHRSHMVNLDHVAELRPANHGEAWLVLRNGQRLKVSRTYRRRLRNLAL